MATAGTEQDRRQAQLRLQVRRETVLAQVRITDVLAALGVDYQPGRRILCIFPDHPEKHPAMQVFEATDSVYCYACCGSGDVIEVVRKCASTNGRVWSAQQAITWLERRFDIEPPPLVEGLGTRLGSRLSRWRTAQAASPTTVGKHAAAAQVRHAVELVLQPYAQSPHGGLLRRTLSGLEEWVWTEAEHTTDYTAWATWAMQLLRGYGATTLRRMSEALETDFAPERGAGFDVPLYEAIEGDDPGWPARLLEGDHAHHDRHSRDANPDQGGQ